MPYVARRTTRRTWNAPDQSLAVALLEAQSGVLELLTGRLFQPNGSRAGLQQRLS